MLKACWGGRATPCLPGEALAVTGRRWEGFLAAGASAADCPGRLRSQLQCARETAGGKGGLPGKKKKKNAAQSLKKKKKN